MNRNKNVQIALRIAAWLVFMASFVGLFTLSSGNRLSWSPDWFSGDKNIMNCGGRSCNLLVGYQNVGFPISVNGAATHGPFALVWTINALCALLVGVGAAVLVAKYLWVALAFGVAIMVVGIALNLF